MGKLVNLINESFGGDFFKISFDIKDLSINDNKHLIEGDKKILYLGKMTYLPKLDDFIVLRKYADNKSCKDEFLDFTNEFNTIVMKNILFSRETDGNIIDVRFEIPIKTFADYKKEILELNKNKVNE